MTQQIFDATMNDIPLASIGGIFITNITHAPAKQNITSQPLALISSDRVLHQQWSQAATTIEFVIFADSPTEQQEKCSAAAAWARKGILKVSNRVGQQLRCICTTPPSIKSGISKNGRVSMILTAFEVPFWEAEIPASLSLSGTSGSNYLFVPGNAGDTLTEVEAAPASGTLNDLTLTVGGHTITLANLGATPTKPLTITYGDNMIQRIQVGTDSALSKRTAGSADDLLAECGVRNAIEMAADVVTNVKFTARGRWL